MTKTTTIATLTTLTLFATVLSLVVSFAPSLARADLGERILCNVYSRLDRAGSPIPDMYHDECDPTPAPPPPPPPAPTPDPVPNPTPVPDPSPSPSPDPTPAPESGNTGGIDPNVGGGMSIAPNASAGGGVLSGPFAVGATSSEIVDTGSGFVLGSSTCNYYLTTYMRMGRKNDVEEVKKLQTFLNAYMESNLPITGYFGPLTNKAVKAFQVKEYDNILSPWESVGLQSSERAGTGYVYKTTQRWINLLHCTDLDIPVPSLP